MHERENALKEWLVHTIKTKEFILSPLAGDASFRRYFRVHYNGLSQIVMDAPPEKEDLAPFIRVAGMLAKARICVPEIIAAEMKHGFLLLSDFGDGVLLNKLRDDTADLYYQEAINILCRLQKCPVNDPHLPAFDSSFMLKEMNVCSEWFFKAYLSLDFTKEEHALIQNTQEWIAHQVAQQPLTFIHRDYHSRNLMLINDEKAPVLGVIDFQDAMRGPLCYDLVSLLKDCYISWPRTKVLEWLTFFHTHNAQAHSDPLPEFIRAFDLCGLQRHLKVLGVFCRLYLRDNKPGYLRDLPLTLHYVLECTEIYEELHPFFYLLQKKVYLP